jgi:ribonuclease P protein subunit RPR2
MRANYRATVEALTNAVELRDEYTGGHVRRVCDYSLALARLVAPALSEEPFVFGYMLHDIGKLAIPDAVLLKPGSLTEAEYELVKTHTTLGAGYIARIPFLLPALAVVRSHHERWDGGGYPDGLEGDAIPLIARIFTVADSLDAMTTDRPYRVAKSLEEALAEFDRCAASQFDPAMVRALRWVVEQDRAFSMLRAGVVPGRDELSFPQDSGR